MSSSVRLPEKTQVVQCEEHHFRVNGKVQKFCQMCGMETAEYVKYAEKKRDAENHPERYEEWVLAVYKEKTRCKPHKHKQKKDDSGS